MSIRRKIRQAYEFVPFKQQLFSIIRRVWLPGDKITNYASFEGDFSVDVEDHGSFKMHHFGHGFIVENELFWGGLGKTQEKLSLSLWVKLCHESNVIFDVGANTGMYSLIAKTVAPSARVFAFEPIRRVYEKLTANVVLNDFDIKCFEAGVSDKDGTAMIHDLPDSHVYSVTIGGSIHGPDVETFPTAIATVRLDSIIEQEQLDHIDLIKIDVETHEPQVMQGFGKYLDLFRPTILIEILSDEIGEQVEEIVKDKGYLYFNIDDKNNSCYRAEHIVKSDYYNYLLCDDKTAEMLELR
jgi:FkbM family methyltransferase